MKSILFVAESLRAGGGVERNTVRLLTALSGSFSPTTIVSIKPSRDAERLQMPEGASTVPLNKATVREAVWPLARVLEHVRPDIIYSGKTHVNVVVALARRKAGVTSRHVASERVHLSTQIAHLDTGAKLKAWLIVLTARWAYRWVDRVVFVSRDALADGRRLLRLSPQKSCAIHNPIVNDALVAAARETVDHPWFAADQRPVVLAAGRLSPQKGFDQLLRAFHTVAGQTTARLAILGEGPERERLEALAKTLKIQDRVDLVGFRANPYKYMAQADVFVLSSLWEGLPTVLVEAMACGAPVVATDCPSGPREIITNESEGILVPPADPADLAHAILMVLSKPDLSNEMRLAGRLRAQDFRVERITRQDEELFLEVLNSG